MDKDEVEPTESVPERAPRYIEVEISTNKIGSEQKQTIETFAHRIVAIHTMEYGCNGDVSSLGAIYQRIGLGEPQTR